MPTKKKIILLLSLMLFFFIFLIFLLINPLKSKIVASKQNFVEQALEYSNQQEEIKQILVDYETFKTIDVDEINSIFLKKGEEIGFIDTLENLAKQNNCELTINLNEPEMSDYSQLLITLKIKGNISSVISFVNAIERQNFYLNYQDINIATEMTTENITNESTAASDILSTEISAISYWQ